MATPKIPVPANPKLFDKVLNIFNTKLAIQLPWLDYAFGQAERLTKKKGGKPFIYPAVYAGQNIEGEYRSVLPDEFFGQESAITGYSFFEVSNIKDENSNPNTHGYITAQVDLIFWFNLDKLLNDASEYRNWDKAIYDIRKAIKKSNRGFKGQILPLGWTKKPEEIFKGYSLRDTQQTYLMHPFAGVRFECGIRFFEDC
jgi:hypothetical protein